MGLELIDLPLGKYLLSEESLKVLMKRLLFIDFSKEFNSVHRNKMAEILKAYGFQIRL